MEKWNNERIVEWVEENLSDEIARCFEGTLDESVLSFYHHSTEQAVDGETLLMLVACASIEQLQMCGLKTVKDHLPLIFQLWSFIQRRLDM